MVGVILDTNIYGKIAADNKDVSLILVKAIKEDQSFIIHNFKVIRDELRQAPKILPLYDSLVCKNIIQLDNHIEKVSDLYFREFKIRGGNQKKDKNFLNDLRIVACASIKGFNLIFSDDNKSMHNPLLKRSIEEINLKYNYRTPSFYKYSDLKRKYLGTANY